MDAHETREYASSLADIVPIVDRECESNFVSLEDMIITGIETPWMHFLVRDYHPYADGTPEDPWATIEPLSRADCGAKIALTATTVRNVLVDLIVDRLDNRWLEDQICDTYLIDIDAEGADSLLQFAVYGMEVFS